LTHSYYAKLLAVKRVTDSRGSKTAGVDQIIWETPHQKITAVKALKRKGYQPNRYVEYISPKNRANKDH
jgi:RNA-directed DNA polymerase